MEDCNMVRYYVEHFGFEDLVDMFGKDGAQELQEKYSICMEMAENYYMFFIRVDGVHVDTAFVKTAKSADEVDELLSTLYDDLSNLEDVFERLKQKHYIDYYELLGPLDYVEAINYLNKRIVQIALSWSEKVEIDDVEYVNVVQRDGDTRAVISVPVGGVDGVVIQKLSECEFIDTYL